MKPMKSEENLVECLALFFAYPYGHFDAGIAQPLYAPALHLCKGVDTAHHHALHPAPDDEVGTWGSLAKVAAWFEAYVKGGFG